MRHFRKFEGGTEVYIQVSSQRPTGWVRSGVWRGALRVEAGSGSGVWRCRGRWQFWGRDPAGVPLAVPRANLSVPIHHL